MEITKLCVVKKLCDRGIFQNESGTVSSVISKEEYQAIQSEEIVDDTFQGSLPAFIAAFTKKRKLSEKEIAEIKKMIDDI